MWCIYGLRFGFEAFEKWRNLLVSPSFNAPSVLESPDTQPPHLGFVGSAGRFSNADCISLFYSDLR